METTMPENQKITAKPKAKPRTDNLRVSRETKKKIQAELAALNRKDFGRTITTAEFVALAVSLLQPHHLDQLKERSLSNRDRLEQRYQDHCAKHGKISKDEFLGLLLTSGQTATN